MTEHKELDLDTLEIKSQLTKSFGTLPFIPRKCVVALNSLILLQTKEEIKESILNDYFMTLLKSFQSKDAYLKYMIHLVIEKIGKEASNSFLSISSLLKDITDKKYKETGIRALFSVIPNQMINDYKNVILEGYVSRNTAVENISSAVYYYLIKNNIAEKWITSPSSNESLIKLALNFELKRNDINFVKNLLQSELKGQKGVFLVKVAFFLYSTDKKNDSLINDILKLRFNNEMVFIQGVKELILLEEEEILKFLNLALSSLKTLLKSKNPITKFSGIKLLSELAKKFPQQCEILSVEVEELINDKNKSINILATTTILLIGSEESASRLINKVTESFGSLTLTYKYFLIEAMTKLILKCKSKKKEFIYFFKIALEENNFDFKIFLLKKIKMIIFINEDEFIKMLSYFIEDSLDYKITIFILGIIASYPVDDQMIKNIFNRLILENNHVRIAALECLTSISKENSAFKEDVLILLNKFTDDPDLSETALFLLDTYELKGTPLKKEELRILNIKKKEETNKLIKETRELEISELNSDLTVKVKKLIYNDLIKVEIKLENALNGILIKEGILSLVFFSKEKMNYEFKFSNLRMNEKKEFTVSLRNEELGINYDELRMEECINVNSVVDYSLCPENDYLDLERETVSLMPFQLTFLDYFIPAQIKDTLNFSSNSSFILEGSDLSGSVQKIIKMFNFLLVSQNEVDNEIKVVLEGRYNEVMVRVVAELWVKENVQVYLDVMSNLEGVSDKIIGLFE